MREEQADCRVAVHTHQFIKTNSITEMIINEKYLQDIDDDDDDGLSNQFPSSPRVIPDVNTKFDHYVRIKYS